MTNPPAWRQTKKVAESDCQHIREKLDLYLDNELLVETNQSVLDHLSFCRDCAAESERRIELRRSLKEALTLEDDDERESENLSRHRVQMALNRERIPRISDKIRWSALAASLILALALGLSHWRNGNISKPANSSAVNTPSSEPTVLIAAVDRDAVENHEVCALSYPPDWTFDQQRVARDLTPRFAPLIDAVNRHPASYKLIEGHICSYEQRKYAHLIFRGQGHTVSVFIEPDDPPGDPKSSRPLQIAQASYKAYQVASVDTGIHRIFVVSDLPSGENRALANQLFPSTIDFIQKLELHAG
jgi:anti-sigma factor RsiW